MMGQTSARRLRRSLLLLLTLMVSAGLCNLAYWQWQRAADKAHRLARYNAAALPLTALGQRPLAELDGGRLAGQATWIAPHAWLLDNQIVDGVAGYDLIIPVRIGPGPLLLVNLGWLPGGRDRATLPTPFIPAKLTLDGIVRAAPGGLLLGQNLEPGPYPQRIQAADTASLATQSGLPLLDALLYQPYPPYHYHYLPSVIAPERHRAYAAQWLGLALVSLVGGLALLRRHDA